MTVYESHIYDLLTAWRIIWKLIIADIIAVIDATFSRLEIFQAFFSNCRRCVYNCDDPLSYKNYSVNKPKLKKKWEIVGLSSSGNLHSVTISRVIISVLKGRRKLGRLRDFSVPVSPLYFLSFPRFFFFLNRPERTVMCTLYIYIASQYLMEILP